MDTEAHPTERDPSRPPSSQGPAGERSRSARMSETGDSGRMPGAADQGGVTAVADPERGPSAALTARLPGGRFTVLALLCVVLMVLADRFLMAPFEIPSRSMEPGLRIGDRVLVNKVAYRFGAEPQRGEVVVFDGAGYFGPGDFIKRVVGVGGDHVVCCDSQGRIEVNGRAVDERRYLYPEDAPSEAPFDVIVPDGTLFLLGDHRSDSSDSRDHLGGPGGGMVPTGAVIGKAEWVAWPARHWGGLHG